MSGTKRLLVCFGLLILFVNGILGLMANLPWKEANEIYNTLVADTPYVSRIAGYLLMALVPIFALLLRHRRGKLLRDVIIASTVEGDIVISENAVIKCLRNVLSQMPNVLNVSAGIKDTRHGALIKVKAQVQISKETLPVVNKQMREKVREMVTKVLGISNIADIKVIIDDIKLPGKEELSKMGALPEAEKKREPGFPTEAVPKKRFP